MADKLKFVKSEEQLTKTKKEACRKHLDHHTMLQEKARKIAIQEQMIDDMSKTYEHQIKLADDAHSKKLKE